MGRDGTSGTTVFEAVNLRADGIADPYSAQLEAYRTAKRRIMNDTHELAEASSQRKYIVSPNPCRPLARSWPAGYIESDWPNEAPEQNDAAEHVRLPGEQATAD
jgi:hypothetical protein